MTINRIISRIFALIIIPFMIMILIVSVSGTHHHIEWYKELLVTVVFSVILVIVKKVFDYLELFLKKYNRQILSVILFTFFLLLYYVSFVNRNTPEYDYNNVYNSAYDFVYGGYADWTYLSCWKNNFTIFLFLSSLMSIPHLIGVQDPFPFLLLINSALTILTGYFIYSLVKQFTNKISMAFFALLVYAIFPPLWAGTNYFYTDSVSLIFGVGAAWNLFCTKKKNRNYIIAGLLWGLGYEIKATVAISLIAALMVMWLLKAEKRINKTLSILIPFMLVLVIAFCVRMHFPNYELESVNGSPISYWLALGIHGNGSYPDNKDFAVNLFQTEGKENKNVLAKEYIENHRDELFSWEHISLKIKYNFASGKMGSSEFNFDEGTLMYEVMNDYGKYGGFSTMFSSAYFYALLFWGIVGFALKSFNNNRENSDAFLTIIQYTVFGLFLFLMIWESNNRQLYNHIPWFTLYGVIGMYSTDNVITRKWVRCNAK